MTECPFCNKPLIKRMVPFSFKGHYFGDFEALCCEDCGEHFFTEDSSEKIEVIAKERNLFGKKYSRKEVLLLLLGARERPIFGKTTLIKEFFLMFKENPLKLFFTAMPEFKPYKYGPYDFGFESLIDLLKRDDLITASEGRYYLTKRGEEVFQELVEGWDEDEILLLKRIRKSWDQKGTHGLMNYIYTNFPGFREKSIVLERFKES